MDLVKLTRQVTSNAELESWRSEPLSFLALESDLNTFLEEISRMAQITYKVVVTRKKRTQNEWYKLPELTELHQNIKLA